MLQYSAVGRWQFQLQVPKNLYFTIIYDVIYIKKTQFAYPSLYG